MEYMNATQAGEKWGISKRRVAVLCEQNRIEGVSRVGNMWLIPKGAPKPADARIKSGKYIKLKTNDNNSSE